MVRLARTAFYLPRGQRGDRRVAAPDEDAFTLMATAFERAVDGLERSKGPVRVEWLGAEGPDLDWAIPVLVGSPCQVARFPGSALALREACERAERESEGLTLVVGSRLLEEPSDPAGTSSQPTAHDGGFAWAFAPSGTRDVSELLAMLPREESSAVDAVVSLALELPGPRSASIGDGLGGEGRPIAPAPSTETDSPSDRLRSVSEGAYVPRPRYLEHLPSRWRFVGEQCGACGAVTFPTRGRCRACGRTEGLGARELPRDGAVVVATTVIGRGGQPTEFDPLVEAFGPYQVVLTELAPGARVPLQVTDAVPGEIRIGDRVDTQLRRLYAMEGEWRYGRKAVPAVRPAGRWAP